jgi:hypothetical protein
MLPMFNSGCTLYQILQVCITQKENIPHDQTFQFCRIRLNTTIMSKVFHLVVTILDNIVV